MSKKYKRHTLNSYWSPYTSSEKKQPKSAASRRKERQEQDNESLAELIIQHIMEAMRREQR